MDGSAQVFATFSVTSAVNDTSCVNIEIVDDDALEGTHTFTALLESDIYLITPGAPFVAIVFITDNEGKLNNDFLTYEHSMSLYRYYLVTYCTVPCSCRCFSVLFFSFVI